MVVLLKYYLFFFYNYWLCIQIHRKLFPVSLTIIRFSNRKMVIIVMLTVNVTTLP